MQTWKSLVNSCSNQWVMLDIYHIYAWPILCKHQPAARVPHQTAKSLQAQTCFNTVFMVSSCVSGPDLHWKLCRWELTAHNCVWPLSGKVSLLQGQCRLCLLLTFPSHLQENRHMCQSKLTSVKAPAQSSCYNQERSEKHSALTVGKGAAGNVRLPLVLL